MKLIAINDQAGNGNGYLDAGEFANLTFRLTNNGHYIAESPHITLQNNEGYIRVITPELTLQDMSIGSSTDVTIEIFVEFLAGEAPAIELILNATCDELVMENILSCPIGFSMESFENGTFNPEYWSNDPQHPWMIVEDNAYEGAYCALSDTTITHDESSWLTFNYTSNEEGTFSFFCKVSSESNYDFLVFSIDDIERDRWSGSLAWYEHTYLVHPGEHHYNWTYTKDYSVSSGSDCAWIDYITLPPFLDKTSEQTHNPLTLHPNPTTDIIWLEIEQDGDFNVQVYDAHGSLILTMQNENKISFKNMPAGIYHIEVIQNGNRWSRKLIKM